MGKLIIPGQNEDEPVVEEEVPAPPVAEVDEDWELLDGLVKGTAEQYPDDSPEEQELRVELALTRHVNQQKIMTYSRLHEVNPMTFVEPLTMFSMRLDLLIDHVIGEEGEGRIAFELAYEQVITGHIDSMAMNVARQRAQALDPNIQGQVQQFSRQQRREQARQMAKQVTQSRGR